MAINASSSSSSSSSFDLMTTTNCGGVSSGAPLGPAGAEGAHQDPLSSFRLLYPMVNENETPLPRQWSSKDRYSYLGLAQNNLRVLYKGSGKNHKDAASVRATHPIPTACGIYYFEVKVISKGRDGYMGIGLSAVTVDLNRLPGWDKSSYGYHGDDGNSFCCSGTGQPYGPTFTTGDIIGCCVNLIDGTCFYTKNGINLGIAFRDLPPNLYPTVGLQTPGEIIEANFGQTPFVFKISDYVKEWEMKIRMKIDNFPVPNSKGEWQMALQRIVLTYLIHHGYYASARAFADSTRQELDEDKTSIQNRQKIQKLVLNGRISEAIGTTQRLYPGLLEQNRDLLFMLKCRQFIEMVNGTDDVGISKSSANNPLCDVAIVSPPGSSSSSPPAFASPNSSPTHPPSSSSVSQTVTGYQYQQQQQQDTSSGHVILPKNSHSSNGLASDPPRPSLFSEEEEEEEEDRLNSTNLAMNGAGRLGALHIATERQSIDSEDEMDITEMEDVCVVNGTSNGTCLNGQTHFDRNNPTYGKDVDERTLRPVVYSEDRAVVERILQFGRDLHAMGEQMKREIGENEANNKALKDAFSLLAYSDPWNSPVGHQLNPVQREPVCTALNSAILDIQGFPKQPPLEVGISQATQCLKLMSKAGIGSCAFASVLDTLHW